MIFLFYCKSVFRGAIAALKIPHAASFISSTITISLGIASIIPTEELSPDWLISQADQALYTAKEQGRDRVSINLK